MPFSLPHNSIYTTYKDEISKEHIDNLDLLFQMGSAAVLIEKLDALSVEFGKNKTYQFVFEYAIVKEQTKLIGELLRDEIYLSYLDLEIVILYLAYSNESSEILLKWLAENQNNALLIKLKIEIKKLLKNESADRNFLLEYSKNPQYAKVVIEAWAEVIEYVMSNQYNPVFNETLNLIYEYLPSDPENISLLLNSLFRINQLRDGIKSIIDGIISHYCVSPANIAIALKNLSATNVFSLTLRDPFIINLLNKVRSIQSQNNRMDKVIELFFQTPTLQQINAFILADVKVLDPNESSGMLVAWLISQVLDESADKLLTLYLDDPQDKSYFIQLEKMLRLASYETLIRYFQSKEMKFPDNYNYEIFGIEELFNRGVLNDDQLSSLIPLILNKEDYDIHKENIYRVLMGLFKFNYSKSISILLNEERVYKQCMGFIENRGDDRISFSDRGQLFPQLLAWYIKNTDKGEALFLTIEEANRNLILQNTVSFCIDNSQPNLRMFIIKNGSPALITLIGGVQQRLYQIEKNQPTRIFMPEKWNKPAVLKQLSHFQRKSMIAYTRKYMHFSKKLIVKNPFTAALAEAAAQAYQGGLLLQHQTTLTNIKSLIDAKAIRSKFHIEDRLLGKGSNGLMTNAGGLTTGKPLFTYFTRIDELDDVGMLGQFKSESENNNGRIIINALQFLLENPLVNFMLIGFYQYITRKTEIVFNDVSLSRDDAPTSMWSDPYVIDFDMNSSNRDMIYRHLFALAFSVFGKKLDEKIKQSIADPLTEDDRVSVRKMLDLLPLEWMIPGDVPLRFSYVEKIEMGKEIYSFTDLRKIVNEADEETVLKALQSFEGLEQFSFALEAILEIAEKRDQIHVVNYLNRLIQNREPQLPTDHIIHYYPDVHYQVESMAQLIMEDYSNERVFVQSDTEKLKIQTVLREHSNRGGAHHAEMAILAYALGDKSLENQNALTIRRNDTLTIPLGSDEQFKSLTEVRDALLTYELTTLLVSAQNDAYYAENNGKFHPFTGRGATNGRVALLKERLFDDGVAYQIVVTQMDLSLFHVMTPNNKIAASAASSLIHYLNISPENILVENNIVKIALTPAVLISLLRRKAVCYEGINIFTEEGRMLMAYRTGKGNASAGGHHGEKYSPLSIAYGLKSEFGLMLKEPKRSNEIVAKLENVKTISRTGIYVLNYADLVPIAAAENYAKKRNMSVPFQADSDEFDLGSEVALLPSEMRGKLFYDVMPLSELCQFQLERLQDYLEKNGLKDKMTCGLNTDLALDISAKGSFKIPSEHFGRLTITIQSDTDEDLKSILIKDAINVSASDEGLIIETDQSPYCILKLLRESYTPEAAIRNGLSL